MTAPVELREERVDVRKYPFNGPDRLNLAPLLGMPS